LNVDPEQHKAALERLVLDHPASQQRLFGPGSELWNMFRESIVFLGGGRAALLQAAHPFVAHAILDHSATKTDMAGRFHRTFTNVFAMVFGTLEEAIASSNRVYSVHARIHGQISEAIGPYAVGHPYSATDVESLHWVHATLIDSAIQAYELILGEVPLSQKQALYAESRRFTALFGIPESYLPEDWTAFRTYFDEMVDSPNITVGRAAQDICGFLQQPPRRSIAPLWHWYNTMTGGLLPPSVRDAFGFPHSPRDQAVFDRSVRALRLAYPRIPDRLRFLPAYSDAARGRTSDQPQGLYARLADRMIRATLG
jgi:uncharacterized protein (DUF2236 family)